MDERTHVLREIERYEAHETVEAGGDSKIEIESKINGMVGDKPITQCMVRLGIPWVTAVKVVCLIDITKSIRLSSLWRFAGCEDPLEGRLYNRQLKFACVRIGDILAVTPEYSDLFNMWYEGYKRRGGWEDTRSWNASRRRIIKLFLKHLWLRWRQDEGIAELCLDDQEELRRFGWGEA